LPQVDPKRGSGAEMAQAAEVLGSPRLGVSAVKKTVGSASNSEG
jgi:hypothetical protein